MAYDTRRDDNGARLHSGYPCVDGEDKDHRQWTLTVSLDINDLLGTCGTDAIDSCLVERHDKRSRHGVVSVTNRSA